MDIIMPQLGETVDSGTVMSWLKQPGDRVVQNEPLFEVETEKVATEIPAPADGVLIEILVPSGQNVSVGTKLAVIAADGDIPAPAASTPARDTRHPASVKSAVAPDPAIAPAGRLRLSPAVRRLIAEHDIPAEQLRGSGRDGRITRADVIAEIDRSRADGKIHIEPKQQSAPQTATAAGDDEIIPFNTLRKRTAEHMVRSKAVSPHVLQATEADFFNIDRLRQRHAQQWRRDEGHSLTFLAFVARAVCLTIREFPRVNATVDGERLIVHRRINLAIAVDLDHEGLLAPVIKAADALTVRGLARAINDLATRARANKLVVDELTQATYTISNSGTYGTLITAPIISQPQVAILSTDAVRKRPVVIEANGGDTIAIRPIGVLAQSFDHRAIDGAYSAAFLQRLREIIETRSWSEEL